MKNLVVFFLGVSRRHQPSTNTAFQLSSLTDASVTNKEKRLSLDAALQSGKSCVGQEGRAWEVLSA